MEGGVGVTCLRIEDGENLSSACYWLTKKKKSPRMRWGQRALSLKRGLQPLGISGRCPSDVKMPEFQVRPPNPGVQGMLQTSFFFSSRRLVDPDMLKSSASFSSEERLVTLLTSNGLKNQETLEGRTCMAKPLKGAWLSSNRPGYWVRPSSSALRGRGWEVETKVSRL